MPIVMAHVGDANRAALTKLEAKWKLGNADTIRRVVVLGLGFAPSTADKLNTEMARRREQAQASHGRVRQPGPKERARLALGPAAGPRKPTISVRLPGPLSKRVTAAGGLRKVVEDGLAVAGSVRR